MKKYLNKRNIYIILFALLYVLCSVCSLIHSFAFFGLANNLPMSIMLGTCFELGQFAVLMSLLTSKKNDGKILPYILLITLTIVQILGNVFSSYKYLMLNSVSDLTYFKTPIFIFTDLPDDITTVIVTWVIGAILPIVCLLLTSMVSNYIMDNDTSKEIENAKEEANEQNIENVETTEEVNKEDDQRNEEIHEEIHEDVEGTNNVDNEVVKEETKEVEEKKEEKQITKPHFLNLN